MDSQYLPGNRVLPSFNYRTPMQYSEKILWLALFMTHSFTAIFWLGSDKGKLSYCKKTMSTAMKKIVLQ